MNILIVLGHVRAGKSTFISHALRSESFRAAFPKAAWIQNDVPFHDGAAQNPEGVKFVGMNAGCFGCADAGTLVTHLRRLEESDCDIAILEPFGFIAGHELPEALHNEGIEFKVIALVSSDLDSLTHVRKEVVESHSKVADLVLMTHGISDGVPGFSLEEPETGIGLVKEMLLDPVSSRFVCNYESLLGRSAEHEHPFTAVEFLRCGLNRQKLQDYVARMSGDGLLRVKGSLDGIGFQAPLPSLELLWDESESEQPDALVIYGEQGYSMPPLPPEFGRRDTATLLRSAGAYTVEERLAALKSLIDQVDARYPGCMHVAPLDRYGRVVVYGEELEEINELRKDPEVMANAPDLCARAVDQRVRIALLGIDQAVANPELFPPDDSVTERLAHYAVTVSYFAARQPWKIAPKRLEEVIGMATDIARCWLMGMNRLVYPTTPAKAYIVASEGAITARYLSVLIDDVILRNQIWSIVNHQSVTAPKDVQSLWLP